MTHVFIEHSRIFVNACHSLLRLELCDPGCQLLDDVISTTMHNVCFVKYDVTVSFLAQVLDTVTYFVSHALDSGYSDIFWHIL